MSVAMWNCYSWPLNGNSNFKATILNSLGSPLAQVGSSAKFGVLIFKASLLYYLGGPSAKVCLFATFCVLLFRAFLLYYQGSIGQSRFLCQFWCTGIQGISGLLPGGLHLTWLYNANWLFTTLIIQKSEEIPTFPEESKWLPNTSHNIYLMMHLGGRSARISAKISFNNNITYYNWQIWALIVEICICHLGGVSGVLRWFTYDMTVQC